MSHPLLLLVDDSQEMGLIVRSLARRIGWEAAARLDAETAWQALGERPDLILLDVNLPGASGLEWLRRVRRTPELADLTVALYTHWGLPTDVAAGLEAGVDFVFDKDLATRPADWQRRLLEIGEAGRMGKRSAHGRTLILALRWRKEGARSPRRRCGRPPSIGIPSSFASPTDGRGVVGRAAPGLDTSARAADTPPDPRRLGGAGRV